MIPIVSVVVNGVSATAAAGRLPPIACACEKALTLITATGINAAGGVGTASVNVVLDTTPPTVRIDSPSG